MLSALSNINGATYPVATGRPQANAARTEAAAAALAALSPAKPVPSVSDPFDDDDNGLSFLYRPNGLPSGGEASPTAVPAQPAANGGNSPSRLAAESTQLSSLLSSLMTPVPAASSAAPPAATHAHHTAASEPLIAKLYQQF